VPGTWLLVLFLAMGHILIIAAFNEKIEKVKHMGVLPRGYDETVFIFIFYTTMKLFDCNLPRPAIEQSPGEQC
jgi:hypothetical protein